MIYTAKNEEVWIHSMGKRFMIRAIADTVKEANQYMENHTETALIACFGPLNIIANQYAGIKNETARNDAPIEYVSSHPFRK